jgi:hypothetical protein
MSWVSHCEFLEIIVILGFFGFWKAGMLENWNIGRMECWNDGIMMCLFLPYGREVRNLGKFNSNYADG